MSRTVRLTVGQAIIRFLAAQYSERDGVEQRLIPGVFGIFGHGNVCGVGQALLQNAVDPGPTTPRALDGPQRAGHGPRRGRLRPHPQPPADHGRDHLDRPRRDQHGHRRRAGHHQPHPRPAVPLGHLRHPHPRPGAAAGRGPERNLDVSANDAFRPVSRFWDRVNRPEQLWSALRRAMRVLTDPAETGAVTVCLPQDVQAEAYDWPVELFGASRCGTSTAGCRSRAALARAVDAIRAPERPLIIAGGGIIYSGATDGAARVRRRHRHPGRRHPGRQGRHQLGPPGGRRRRGLHRQRRGQRAGRRGRPDHRHRHPLLRLHHRRRRPRSRTRT